MDQENDIFYEEDEELARKKIHKHEESLLEEEFSKVFLFSFLMKSID